MKLIACPGCGRRKTIEVVSNRPKRCTNCNASAGQVFNHVKIWMLTDYEGDEPEAAKENTFKGLLWLAKAWKFKPEWAAIKFRRLYNEWPEYLAAQPELPRQELVSWAVREKSKYAAAIRKIEKEYENGNCSRLVGFDLSDAGEYTGQGAEITDG